MNQNQYQTSLNEAVNALIREKLAKRPFDRKWAIAKEFITATRSSDYKLMYKVGVETKSYDLLMFDESLLQFDYFKKGKTFIARYAYIQSPYLILSYENYLKSAGYDYSEVGEEFREAYEAEKESSTERSQPVAIRYDYSESEYSKALHSVSHVHFGQSNSIRVSSGKVLTPLMFVLFMLKQVYFPEWKSLFRKRPFATICGTAKGRCSSVDRKFFDTADKLELYLT